MAEQFAITPEHFSRSTSRSSSIDQVTLGSEPKTTDPWNHRVTAIVPALFPSAATIPSAESSESTVSVRPSSAKDATYRVSGETGDGSVDVSVPRDDAGTHVVSARTGDGKITVRTANQPARVFVLNRWENDTGQGE